MTSLLTNGVQTPISKVCNECREVKPLSAFNRDAHREDGLQRRCRACFSKYNAERYARHQERFKAAVKQYKETNPREVLATRLKTWERNPSRLNCYRVVEAALNAGEIVKPEACCICGTRDDEAGKHGLHKHHFDYGKPLDVVWLCAKCHGQIHKIIRERRKEVAA